MISFSKMSWSGMIDFSGLNKISGLSSHEIQEICDVQELLRHDLSIINENFDSIDVGQSTCQHVVDVDKTLSEGKLSNEAKEKMQQLQESAIPSSTLYQTRRWSEAFLTFLREKGLENDFKNMSSSLLDEYLGYFYSELRTKDGNFYSPASLNCARASLFRYFKRPPLCLKVDIIHDTDFFNSNEILKAMTKKYAESGGSSKHFEAIEEADLKKLRIYFDRSTPEKLQEEVYFILEYYLGLRGREWIKYFERRNILFMIDSNGNEFIEVQNINVIQKNQQPAVSSSCRMNYEKQGRIYASPKVYSCPVEAIRLLDKKLPPEAKLLFYRKKKDWKTNDFWYNAALPMGKNTVGALMKRVSISAELSKNYTSHCIRPTVVTTMFNCGLAVNDIQCVTGHKNKDSVKRYLRVVGDKKKKEYSDALNRCFNEEQDQISSSSTSSNDSKLIKVSIFIFQLN